MTHAYCICCNCLKDDTHMKQVFRTGFIRIQRIDYPLGVCTIHIDAVQKAMNPRKIAN